MGFPALTRILASLALVVGLLACDVGTFPVEGEGGPDASVGAQPLAFVGQIQQDFTAGGCIACHGQTPIGNDYQIISYMTTLVAVVPNDALASSLVTEMDPNGAPRIEHATLAIAARHTLYTNWILAGAPETAPAPLP